MRKAKGRLAGRSVCGLGGFELGAVPLSGWLPALSQVHGGLPARSQFVSWVACGWLLVLVEQGHDRDFTPHGCRSCTAAIGQQRSSTLYESRADSDHQGAHVHQLGRQLAQGQHEQSLRRAADITAEHHEGVQRMVSADDFQGAAQLSGKINPSLFLSFFS